MAPPIRTVRLILGDQLNIRHPWFAQVDDSVLYLMAELHQSVVVCNRSGRILLYNGRARGLFRRPGLRGPCPIVQVGHERPRTPVSPPGGEQLPWPSRSLQGAEPFREPFAGQHQRQP